MSKNRLEALGWPPLVADALYTINIIIIIRPCRLNSGYIDNRSHYSTPHRQTYFTEQALVAVVNPAPFSLITYLGPYHHCNVTAFTWFVIRMSRH